MEELNRISLQEIAYCPHIKMNWQSVLSTKVINIVKTVKGIKQSFWTRKLIQKKSLQTKKKSISKVKKHFHVYLLSILIR